MMEFQASPVEHLRRVKNALPKVWKFAWSSKLFCSLTSAKRKTPSTENMKRIKSRSPPIFVMAGMVITRVSKMTLIPFASLMNLKMRDILKALMNVVEAPKSNFNVTETILETIEVTTMMKSKIFPKSR